MKARHLRLRDEAEHLIAATGILNDVEVLQSVLRLRPRPRPDSADRYSWRYVCEVIDMAYLLGLRVGAHFVALPSAKAGRDAQ